MEHILNRIPKWKAWLIAIRLPTLLIPTIQVWTGTAVAWALTPPINRLVAFYAWVVAVAITIGTNLINDAVDYDRGGDPVNRFGFPKVIPAGLLTRRQVYLAGLGAFALACAVPFALQQDVWICFAFVLASSICGYCYTGGPYPISYLGLSEIFIFIFYGGVCVIVPYYAQAYKLTPEIFLAAAQMGLLAILPNALNNFRDIDADANAHKKTLAVRFGKSFARNEIAAISLLPYALNGLWLALGHPLASLLPLLLLPLAFILIKGVWRHDPSHSLNRYFGVGVIMHFLFGIFLTLGLMIG